MGLSTKELELYNNYNKLDNPIIELEMDILGKVYSASYGSLNNGKYFRHKNLSKKDISRIIDRKIFRNSKEHEIKELADNKKLVYIHLI